MLTDDSELTARRLRESDWRWIEEWFRDPVLDARLGPVDEEWLREALTAQDGVHLVVRDPTGRPVALLGCVWDDSGNAHAFTDAAVNPVLRGRGYGRRALRTAMADPAHPPCRGWLAFVAPDNAAAFAFFERCGWQHDGIDDGMHRFTIQL